MSKVNTVKSTLKDNYGLAFNKTYHDRAIATGIRLPMRRSLIERKVAKALSLRCRGLHNGIVALPVISYSFNTNTFPFIDGDVVRSLPASKWPSLEVFRRLGRLVARLEVSTRPCTLNGLQIASRRLGNIIRIYKTGSTAKSRKRSFSLGDLTLANLMISKNTLFLIDFEFAHFSSPAFDIGTLLAELDYRCGPTNGRRRARLALLQGYVEGKGRLADVMVWRNRLASHQKKSRYKRERLHC